MDVSDPLLLDTHTWLWMENGLSHKFKRGTRSVLEQASRENLLAVSAISVWEIGMLVGKSRLRLGRSLDDWLAVARSAPGLNVAAVTPDIALDASRLEELDHGDPADRIIIATARSLNATLLTSDARILAYGKRGFCLTRHP
jgi:PIN domain nuclease of toxin-antitoxin system